MAIDLMDVQGVPRLGRGTGEAYERVRSAWEANPASGTPAVAVETTRAALR